MSEHIKYYIAPLTQVLALWGFYTGGDYVWIAVAWLPVLALLDTILPADRSIRKIKSKALAYIPIIDVKKIFLKTTVTGTVPAFGGAPAYSRVSVNPLVIHAGLSYRF